MVADHPIMRNRLSIKFRAILAVAAAMAGGLGAPRAADLKHWDLVGSLEMPPPISAGVMQGEDRLWLYHSPDWLTAVDVSDPAHMKVIGQTRLLAEDGKMPLNRAFNQGALSVLINGPALYLSLRDWHGNYSAHALGVVDLGHPLPAEYALKIVPLEGGWDSASITVHGRFLTCDSTYRMTDTRQVFDVSDPLNPELIFGVDNDRSGESQPAPNPRFSSSGDTAYRLMRERDGSPTRLAIYEAKAKPGHRTRTLELTLPGLVTREDDAEGLHIVKICRDNAYLGAARRYWSVGLGQRKDKVVATPLKKADIPQKGCGLEVMGIGGAAAVEPKETDSRTLGHRGDISFTSVNLFLRATEGLSPAGGKELGRLAIPCSGRAIGSRFEPAPALLVDQTGAFFSIDIINPEKPALLAVGTPMPPGADWAVFQGGWAIMGGHGKSSTTLFDISQPLQPRSAGSVPFSGAPFLRSALAVGFGPSGAIEIVDFKDPQKPLKLAELPKPDAASSGEFKMDGNHLCVAGNHGVVLYDIASPASPRKMGAIQWDVTEDRLTTGFALRGNWLYGFTSAGEIGVYDLANPESPKFSGWMEEDRPPPTDPDGHAESQAEIAEGLLFVSAGYYPEYSPPNNESCRVYDLADPGHPKLIATYDSPLPGVVQGDYIYAAGHGLRIYRRPKAEK